MDFLLRPVGTLGKFEGNSRSFSLSICNVEHVLLVIADPGSRIDHFEYDGGFVVAVGNFFSTKPFNPQNLLSWVRGLKGQFFIWQQDNAVGVRFFTDHLLSVRPYHIHTQHGYLMSTRLDLVAQGVGSALTVRYENLFCFVFGASVGCQSFFHEIGILPPSSAATLGPERLHVEGWWQAQNYDRPNIRILTETLVSNAVDWLEHCPTSAVGLTGGADSRLLLAAFATAADRLGRPLNTFTAGHDQSHDVYLANSIAGNVGTRHVQLDYRENVEIRKILEDLETGDPLWMTTSGEARHTFVYMHWMREALRRRGITCKLSGLGGEVFKGRLYREVNKYKDLRAAVQTWLKLPNVDCFAGAANEALGRTGDYFLKQSFSEVPEGLNDYKATDWWCRQNIFSRGWASRYHFWGGSVHYPLLDQEVLDCAEAFPAEAMFDAALQASIIDRLHPEINNVPMSSGTFSEDFKPSIAWRIRRLISSRVLGIAVRQPNDPAAIRPYIVQQWKSVAVRLAASLPGLEPLAKRIDDTPLFGLTQDFRMYYAMRFLDDLIHVHGVKITESQ